MSLTGEARRGNTLLERDGLLARLEHLVGLAGDGAGSVAMIAGEAGAGKTSLMNELAHRIEGQGRVLIGGCDPLATPRPLSPLLDIAADPEAHFTGPDRLDLDPFSLFADVLDDLKGTIRPTLLVIEDMHWADEATLDFLRYIGRRVADTKAVVACTYREDELGPDHPLRTVLGDLATRESTVRFSVDPLTVEAVGYLASESRHDPAELHRLTGGNAFYVTEVLATGEDLPDSVSDAVMARVRRLTPLAQRVVEAVSVAPRDLVVDHALALSGADLSDVDEATMTGVVVARGERLAFRHELARSAVEGSLPMGRRLTLHREMIDLLRADENLDLARLAHHASRAGDGNLVIEYAPEAARQASSRGAHREAAEFFELALVEADRMLPSELAKVRLDLAVELSILDRQEQALHQFLLAAEFYREGSDHVSLAGALRQLSTALWRNSDLEGSRRAIDEAIQLLESAGDDEALALAHEESAYNWMLARRHAPALEDLARCKELAERSGAEHLLLLHDYMAATVEIVMGEPNHGVDELKRVESQFRERGHDRLAATALSMLGSGGGEVRRYASALDALNRAIEEGLRTDADYAVAYNRSWMARIAFEQGRWDEATGVAELVLGDRFGRAAIAPVTALGALGRVRVRRGDPGARQALEEALRIGEGCEMQHLWSPYCGLAELAWLEGRVDEIPEILDWVWVQALVADSRWARGEVGFWMWRAGAIDGPPDLAAEPFAFHMDGKWREAADTWHEIGCPYEEGLALAEGDEEAMLRAITIFDSLGARPAAGMIRIRLRRMGVEHIPQGPRLETRSNPAGLTNRQVEVLGLMVEGLSNGEIADRLYISKKTTEHHVSAVMAKLGTPTRAKAIARAESLLEPKDGGGSAP
ncbi:MAG TPA: AAA family ATPase [Acidimicrobiia bacterium]|nr:AAA family ATPase [Acidimicrobiia bacterium]